MHHVKHAYYIHVYTRVHKLLTLYVYMYTSLHVFFTHTPTHTKVRYAHNSLVG